MQLSYTTIKNTLKTFKPDLDRKSMETTKNLVTIKKASTLTGASPSFLKQLLREGKLKRFKINSAVYVSMTEFEHLATPKQ